jgi:hypothetical protein
MNEEKKRENHDFEENRIEREWTEGGRRREREDENKPIHHSNRNIITILPFQYIYMYYLFLLYDSLQWATFTKNHGHKFSKLLENDC